MNHDYNVEKELENLRAQLVGAIKFHQTMKDVNKVIKVNTGPPSQLQQVINLGLTEDEARKILQPDFARHIGYAPWRLTNNNATIKRWQAKIELLERKLQAEQSGIKEFIFVGGSVVLNFGVDRLQIFFDVQPDEDIRKKLKRNGFKWAPTANAWQRQITDAACRSAEAVLGVQCGVFKVA